MKKPDSRYAEMGIGERTEKGEPAPGKAYILLRPGHPVIGFAMTRGAKWMNRETDVG